jgi:hypothetical protein
MSTRRSGDAEIREIFSLATTGHPRDRSLPAESGGMTLDELQKAIADLGMFGGCRSWRS